MSTKQRVSRSLKTSLDRHAPAMARGLRALHQRAYYGRQAFHDSGLGFVIAGEPPLQIAVWRDSPELATFRRSLDTADVVIDIGANVGLFTCLAAQSGRYVVAVEPLPQNVQMLCGNVHQNRLTGVEVVPVALSDTVTVLPLLGTRTTASLMPEWGARAAGKSRVLVPVTTLDTILGDRFTDQRILVKLDAEGLEHAILCGASRLLARETAPVWLIEHGLTEHFPEGINPHFADLFDLFWQHGYRAFVADGDEREVTPADVKRWVANRARDFGSINFVLRRD